MQGSHKPAWQKNANTGTNKQTNIGTSTHTKKNILILTFPSCPCLCSSLADGLKKSARPWHCSVHQFIAPDWNICRKENCIDITTNEQIVCATMAKKHKLKKKLASLILKCARITWTWSSWKVVQGHSDSLSVTIHYQLPSSFPFHLALICNTCVIQIPWWLIVILFQIRFQIYYTWRRK